MCLWLDTFNFKQWERCFLFSLWLHLNSDPFSRLHFIHLTAGILCLSTRSLSPCTFCKPGTTIQSPVTSTVGDSWRMTHNAVQPCLQCGRLLGFPLFFFFAPQPPHSSESTPSQPRNLLTTTHKLDLCIHIPPQVNADTWQIKGLINSLCWTISPHHQRMKNKQNPRQLAQPGHLVGLSVDDWVAQGCSVWGLGRSHNCFLWAAQPPEPLHNWLSGWYSPPPSSPLIPQTPALSPLPQTLLSPPILSTSGSPVLGPFPVALIAWNRLKMFLNLCLLH